MLCKDCWVEDQNKNNCCIMTSWMRESVSEWVTNKFIEELSSYIKSWILIKKYKFYFHPLHNIWKKILLISLYAMYYENVYTFWSWYMLHFLIHFFSSLFNLRRIQHSFLQMNEFSNVKEKQNRKKTQYICKWV